MPLDVKEVIEHFWESVRRNADVETAAGFLVKDVVFHLFGNTDSGIDSRKQSTHDELQLGDCNYWLQGGRQNSAGRLASRALPEMVGIWLFDRVPRFAFPTF